ncbi:MAG: hypothetical protein AAF940_01770 [Pseudomonadota bacterium]
MNAKSPSHLAVLSGITSLHYRRIQGGNQLDAVGALRAHAFNSKEIYTEKFDGPVIEAYDDADGSYVFGLYAQDTMLATVRLNVLSRANADSPAVQTFPAELRPLIDQGMTFIDPSRLAVDPLLVEQFPALPIYILRTALIATTHFEVNQCLAVVRTHHEAFYRRVFRSTRLGGPVDPGNTYDKLVLLGSVRENTRRIQERYPIFNFNAEEREALFADIPAGQSVSAPVMASAAQVIGLDQSDFLDIDRYKVA